MKTTKSIFVAAGTLSVLGFTAGAAGAADVDLGAFASPTAVTAKETARRTLDEIDDLQQSDREKAAVAAATVSSPAPA